MNHRVEDLIIALRVISMIPQAYHNRGAQFCVEDMERVAKLALYGGFNGVAGEPAPADPFNPPKPVLRPDTLPCGCLRVDVEAGMGHYDACRLRGAR